MFGEMAGIFVCTFRLLLVLVVEDMLNTLGSMFIFLEDMLYYSNKQKPQILHISKYSNNTLDLCTFQSPILYIVNQQRWFAEYNKGDLSVEK